MAAHTQENTQVVRGPAGRGRGGFLMQAQGRGGFMTPFMQANSAAHADKGQPKEELGMDAEGVAFAKMNFDGKRMRRPIQRRTVDYNHSLQRYLQQQIWIRDRQDQIFLRPDPNFIIDLLPPAAYLDNPINAVPIKHVHTSTNKIRCPVNVVRWTPEGRRLITGSSSGEFTLWNGLTFNFETILQAHDSAVRAMRWSHSEQWMVTADHAGVIKYWQNNMNNLKVWQGHKEAVRDLAFAPTDTKFATCGDDALIKIWDFNTGNEERILSGHGWDVKCVDWHPVKGLLASGSKDNLLKLWDPKTGKNLTTLHGHKNTILGLQWNKNGNWLATAGRDQIVKVFDVRQMKEVEAFRGHKKEVCSVVWHPIHERLLATGGSEGSLMYWICGQESNVGSKEDAHESNVWSLDWHPVGHLLVSGANDHTTKFWTRPRPGDALDGTSSQQQSHSEQEDEEPAGGMPAFRPSNGGIPGLGGGPPPFRPSVIPGDPGPPPGLGIGGRLPLAPQQDAFQGPTPNTRATPPQQRLFNNAPPPAVSPSGYPNQPPPPFPPPALIGSTLQTHRPSPPIPSQGPFAEQNYRPPPAFGRGNLPPNPTGDRNPRMDAQPPLVGSRPMFEGEMIGNGNMNNNGNNGGNMGMGRVTRDMRDVRDVRDIRDRGDRGRRDHRPPPNHHGRGPYDRDTRDMRGGGKGRGGGGTNMRGYRDRDRGDV